MSTVAKENEYCNSLSELLARPNAYKTLSIWTYTFIEEARHGKISSTEVIQMADILRSKECSTTKIKADCSLWSKENIETVIPVLIEALQRNCTVTDIDFENVDLSESDAIIKAFSELFKVNTTVKKVNLKFCKITSRGATMFSIPFHFHSSMKELSLSCNNIGASGAITIAEVFKVNSTIKEVSLGGNHIGDEGAIVLAEAFKVNSTIEFVDLHDNLIYCRGATALAKAFTVNSSIEVVDLSFNGIKDRGAISLAKTFLVNYSIQVVNLDSNEIGCRGANLLVGVLDENPSIRQICLDDNTEDLEFSDELDMINAITRTNEELALNCERFLTHKYILHWFNSAPCVKSNCNPTVLKAPKQLVSKRARTASNDTETNGSVLINREREILPLKCVKLISKYLNWNELWEGKAVKIIINNPSLLPSCPLKSDFIISGSDCYSLNDKLCSLFEKDCIYYHQKLKDFISKRKKIKVYT